MLVNRHDFSLCLYSTLHNSSRSSSAWLAPRLYHNINNIPGYYFTSWFSCQQEQQQAAWSGPTRHLQRKGIVIMLLGWFVINLLIKLALLENVGKNSKQKKHGPGTKHLRFTAFFFYSVHLKSAKVWSLFCVQGHSVGSNNTSISCSEIPVLGLGQKGWMSWTQRLIIIYIQL